MTYQSLTYYLLDLFLYSSVFITLMNLRNAQQQVCEYFSDKYPPLLKKFIKHFASCFTTKPGHFETLLRLRPVQRLQRNSPETMAKAAQPIIKTPILLPDSLWDLQAIKQKAQSLKIKEPLPQQKMDCLPLMTRGVLRPYTKNTEGAKWQYCGPLKKKKSVMWGVQCRLRFKDKTFSLDIVPYLPANEFPGGKNNPHS